jgi:hypothetical protein
MQPQTPHGNGAYVEEGHFSVHHQYTLQMVGAAAQHRRLGHNHPNTLRPRPGRDGVLVCPIPSSKCIDRFDRRWRLCQSATTSISEDLNNGSTV